MMRIRFLTGCITAAVLCGTLVPAAPAVRAGEVEDDHQQGGMIQGVEGLQAEVTLTPSAGAPDGLSGEAELRAGNRHGTTAATIRIEPKGLPAGTYTVTVTKKSDGTVVELGTFDVATASSSTFTRTRQGSGESETENENEIEDTKVVFGTAANPFPLDFNPLDTGVLTISDVNGVALLTADFTNATAHERGSFVVSVKAAPGADDADAAGGAVISVRSRKGAVRGVFMVRGRNLPADTDVVVRLDDTEIHTARTNRRGSIRVFKTSASRNTSNQLPSNVNIFAVHTLTVEDTSGHELLTAHF